MKLKLYLSRIDGDSQYRQIAGNETRANMMTIAAIGIAHAERPFAWLLIRRLFMLVVVMADMLRRLSEFVPTIATYCRPGNLQRQHDQDANEDQTFHDLIL